MGRRGPAPAPVAQKLAKGETRTSRLNHGEPLPRSRPPVMPKGLSPAVRAVWRHVLQEMPEGVIVHADRDALRCYCEAVVRYNQYAQDLADTGALVRGARNGDIIASPLNRLMREERNAVKEWARELGLTPSARANLSLDPQHDGSLSEAGRPGLRVVGG